MDRLERDRRDRRLLIALMLFTGSLLAAAIQLWIFHLYINAIISQNWTYFSRLFSVDPPAMGPKTYCLDRCVAELPVLPGWIAVVAFLLGWMFLVYSWWKPREFR